MKPLFRRHHSADQTRYQDTARTARDQRVVLRGTPGTLMRRERGNNHYWTRQYVRVDGAKDDEYFGAVEAIDASRLAALRASIQEAQSLAKSSGDLRLVGYQRLDKKPAAVLGALFNAGLFRAGLVLVGSHAFGVLLNELGLIVPAYRTKDLDLARDAPLALALPTDRDFLAILNESELGFVPVPGFPSSQPSASFKLPGISDLLVDLLVPGSGDQVGRIVPVRELRTHAQSIPFLSYLLDEPMATVVLSPNQIIPVTVPRPERFAIHKLISSQQRKSEVAKGPKDLEQAAILIAALEADFPGRIAQAWEALPRGARTLARDAAARAEVMVRDAHPEAALLLEGLVDKRTARRRAGE